MMYQHDSGTSHQLFDALALSAGIVISISFQKVYDTPHAKTCADCDYKSF